MTVAKPRALTPGQQFGPYVVQSMLGAGGMGEVYRVRDAKLQRDVAIKVLPPEFTSDADRLARFEREAKMLASLNHQNIAAIYGFEESAGVKGLVLEYIEGETLSGLIARGPIVLEEAVPIARQVCEALAAAHERGIVHRDLKPSNIRLRPDGVVKVLDFGLAKSVEPSSADNLSHSPTMTSPTLTRMGVILGTAAYMSPEQAKGRRADARSDIFAFGCVLYEMLSARLAFDGDGVSETLAAILRSEPDWSVLPATVPPSVHRLLRRCLEKDRRRRIADIDDVRFELEEALTDTASAVSGQLAAPPAPRLGRMLRAAARVLPWTAAAVAAWFLWHRTNSEAPTERVPVPLEPGVELVVGPSVAVAPSADGRRFVYVTESSGKSRLVLRESDRFDSIVMAGTDGAIAPFFSADGNWVGFFANGALWKVAVRGGAPLKIADMASLLGGSWGPDGAIFYSTAVDGEGLWRVSSDGGRPEPLTTPDGSKGELRHTHPQVVDEGRRVVFTVVKADASYAGVLETGSRSWRVSPDIRFESGHVEFVPTGHLIYALRGQLMASPFDLRGRATTGASFAVEGPVDSGARSAGQFAVSAGGSGALLYVPSPAGTPRETLVLVDRDGVSRPLLTVLSGYRHPRFSPDGQHLAVAVEAESGTDIWVYDLRRRTRIRLTTTGQGDTPIWSRDGRTVTFFGASGPWTLLTRPADGSTTATAVLTHEPTGRGGSAPSFGGLLPGAVPTLTGVNPQYPGDWMNGGDELAFTESKANGERDIWVTSSGSEPVPFLVTSFDESSPAFSPDGKYLAYVSNETGANEVYVQSYPGPGGRWVISDAGGDDPVWSPTGREILYRRGDTIVAAAVQTTPAFVVGNQRRLFHALDNVAGHARNFDVSPDGRHFVMVTAEGARHGQEIRLVRNWFQRFDPRRRQLN